jgi:hypothetical protein
LVENWFAAPLPARMNVDRRRQWSLFPLHITGDSVYTSLEDISLYISVIHNILFRVLVAGLDRFIAEFTLHDSECQI